MCRNLTYTLLSLLVLGFYIAFYVPYGFEDTDTGFILGLSWQFYNGSRPFAEILYVRPPSSFILHSLSILAGDYALFIDRSFMYIQIFVSSLLSILLLANKFKYLKPERHFIFILSFIVSVHTFPPMSWHTIDGIFFLVLGLYFLLTFHSTPYILVGSLFITLGVLSKQSFYLFPILLLIYLYLTKNKKKLFVSLTSFILYFSTFAFILYLFDIWGTYITLTTGQISFYDFLDVGFYHYFKVAPDLLLFLFPIGLIYLFQRLNKHTSIKINIFNLTMYWSLTINLLYYLSYDSYILPSKNFIDVFFNLTILYGFYMYFHKNHEEYLLPILLLSISWMAGISWGYNTVILFSSPIIFMTYVIFRGNKDNTYIKKSSLIIFSIIVFYVGYDDPFQNDKRSKLVFEMSTVYPKLKGIYSDRDTYLKYQELKRLSEKHNKNFIVLPDVTLAHYLSNTTNPIGIDWVINAEINDNDTKLINRIEDKDLVVFIKKGKLSTHRKFGSRVTSYIKDNWNHVGSYHYFDVFKK